MELKVNGLWPLVSFLALLNGVGRVEGWTNVTGQWENSQCHKYDQYKCGDECLKSDTLLMMQPCDCGGKRLDRWSQWCCMSPDGNCSTDFNSAKIQVDSDDYDVEIDCKGKVLHNSQTCHGKCKPPVNKVLGYSGLLWPGRQPPGHQRACSANISSPCVDGYELCHGEAKCPDKSDLQWCLKDNYENQTGITHCTGHLKSQVFSYRDMYDGQYHCLDRSDEDPFLLYDQRINSGRTREVESCCNATRPPWMTQDYKWTSHGYMTEEHECISQVFWCYRDVYFMSASPEVM